MTNQGEENVTEECFGNIKVNESLVRWDASTVVGIVASLEVEADRSVALTLRGGPLHPWHVVHVGVLRT